MRFLAACAAVAVVFGVAHDAIDVRISPEFYRVYKHASPDVPVWLVAVRAGVVSSPWMGLLLSAAMLSFADVGAQRSVPVARLYGWIAWPVACAAAGSALGAMLGPMYVGVAHGRNTLPGTIEQGIRVRQVVGMHAGVYAGAFIGGMVACAGIYRTRRNAQCRLRVVRG